MQRPRFSAWSGKIPRAEQLSLWVQLLSQRSRAHMPQLPKPEHLESTLRNERSHLKKQLVHSNEE